MRKQGNPSMHTGTGILASRRRLQRDRESDKAEDELTAWEEVLGEPASTHSMDCVWIHSYKCFTCGKNCCYKFLTTVCGICIALYWGCEFAMLAFQQIWCCTPSMSMYAITCGTCQKCWGTCIACWLQPLCETFSYCLYNIRVKHDGGGSMSQQKRH